MAGEQRGASGRRQVPPGLAVTSALVWFAAGLSARWLGIWPALGGAAVVLGAWALLVDASGVRSRFVPGRRLLARGLALGLVTGAVTAAATYLLYPVVVTAFPWLAAQADALYDAFRAPSALVVALALVPIVVGEELVWRGVVQGAVARRHEVRRTEARRTEARQTEGRQTEAWPTEARRTGAWPTGAWRTAVLTAALYALAGAAVGSTLLVLVSFGLGLVWSLVRGWSGSLVAPIVAHVTWNVVVLIWLPLDRL